MSVKNIFWVAALGLSLCHLAVSEEVTQAETIDSIQATGVYRQPPELVKGVELSAELPARQLAMQKRGDWLEHARRWRPVHINTDAFFAVPDNIAPGKQRTKKDAPLRNSISVALFPGEIVELHNTSVREWHNGALGWSGMSSDQSIWGRFTVSRDNDLDGYLRTVDGQKYTIKKIRGSSFHVVAEVEPTALLNKEF